MRCPSYLKDEAKEFWQRHAKALEAEGMLTEADADSFAQLCDIWRHLRKADPSGGINAGEDEDQQAKRQAKERVWYIGLNKQYCSLAKQFGLLPRDRKKSGLSHEEDITDILNDKLGADAK